MKTLKTILTILLLSLDAHALLDIRLGSDTLVSIDLGSKKKKTELISCSSYYNQTVVCQASGKILGLRLVHQSSYAPCLQGRDFSIDDDKIIVRNNCSADFEVQYIIDKPIQPPSPPVHNPIYRQHVYCESLDYRYATCNVGRPIIRLDVVRQYSDSICVLNKTYGFHYDSVWVTSGCRAEFSVTTH